MKSAVRLAFLAVSLWAGFLCDASAASATSSRLERVYVYGVEYVRLEDWSRSLGGQVRWSVPKREVSIALPSGTLRFTVDQRRCEVKGVEVSLSAPVAYRGSSALISAADVSSTLLPILSPAKNPPGRGIKTIVLDPGHGGKDPMGHGMIVDSRMHPRPKPIFRKLHGLNDFSDITHKSIENFLISH